MSGASPLLDRLPEDHVTSYDLPLQPRANPAPPCHPHLPSGSVSNLKTTSFTKDITGSPFRSYPERSSPGHPNTNGNAGGESSLSHGFFFGLKSIEYTSLDGHATDSDGDGHDGFLSEGDENDDDDDDDDDDGLSKIYRAKTGDPNMWIRQSDRSFRASPDGTPRHVLSKRIGTVGGIGQNLGLGHRLGVLTADTALIPKTAQFEVTAILILEDSPMQVDIRWSKPQNASNFSTLVYRLDACLPDAEAETETELIDGVWQELTSSRQAVFRVYHTDDTLLVGKHRLKRRVDDVIVKLRVCCHGELSVPNQASHWTASSFSKIAEVTFAGYQPRLVEKDVQLTSL